MIRNNKRKVKIIGITGGISTGKSTASDILRKKGYPVIDADKIAREVVMVGKPAYNDIVNEFGKDVLNPDLTINREKLANIVFNDSQKRLILNNIVHPRVIQEMKNYINKYSKDNNIVFLDIPLLIEEKDKLKETGIIPNEIWLVYTDEDTQLQRLMDRDKIDVESALNRIKAQMPISEKVMYADVVIDNTKSLSNLEKEIDMALERIKKYFGGV